MRVGRFIAIGLSFVAMVVPQAPAIARAHDASKHSQVPDSCWQAVEAKYGITPQLMAGIAEVESAFRPQAVNTTHLSKTKSIDIGLAQINSRWLATLSRFGITQKDLFDACTNLHIGGWILSDLIRKHGNTWEAVGAYNAACTQLKGDDCKAARSTYAWKVHKAMVKFFGTQPLSLGQVSTSPHAGQFNTLQIAAAVAKLPRIASLDLSARPRFSRTDEAPSEQLDEPSLSDNRELATNSRIVQFQDKGLQTADGATQEDDE